MRPMQGSVKRKRERTIENRDEVFLGHFVAVRRFQQRNRLVASMKHDKPVFGGGAGPRVFRRDFGQVIVQRPRRVRLSIAPAHANCILTAEPHVLVASFGDAFGRTPGARDIVFRDLVSNVYKRLVVSEDGRLVLGGMLVGARVDQLPLIWQRLVDAGFESGHAYAKALRP
jgi:hypothetical protein